MEASETSAPAEVPTVEWAVVEVYGHRRHVGRIQEEQRFGTSMLRIDVPSIWIDRAGNRGEPVWTTHWYGGAAIFSITHTDESSAMKAAEAYRPSLLLVASEFDEVCDENDSDDTEEA